MKQVPVFALIAFGAGLRAEGREPDLNALYNSRRWFELRDAVAADAAAPAFYRGAVAWAFHDVRTASQELQSVIQSAPDSAAAREARRMLLEIAQRNGDFRWGQGPDQHAQQLVIKRKHAHSSFELRDGRMLIPVSINERTGNYVLETDAQESILSESEAGRLGLPLHPIDGRMTNGENGIGFQYSRVAIADRLTVGKTEFRNVAFAVLPDDRMLGQRGIIGLPVLLGLETLRWKTDGKFESGFASEARTAGQANICLDGLWLATEGEFENKRLFLGLSTGATSTNLYVKFQEQFRGLVDGSGIRETRRIASMESGRDFAAASLSEVTLRVGGSKVILRPAHVLLDPTPYPWYHGDLGMDLIRQASEVTLDFRKMTLTLK